MAAAALSPSAPAPAVVPASAPAGTAGPGWRAQAAMLPDGRRMHLHHGPIDLVVEAFGPEPEIRAALAQAEARFASVLDALVAELPRLRAPLPHAAPPALSGPVAGRMLAACLPHAERFVTPMAAVAGAVADEVLAAMTAGRSLTRAYANNGGDAAIWLAPGAAMRVALGAPDGVTGGRAEIRAGDAARGVATSGWRGRSHSLGIADAVTVLARTAAAADVAATLIANAVDLPGHPAIRRGPARAEAPDSDLGDRLVTLGVGPLTPDEAEAALDAGLSVAEDMRARGLVEAAALTLAGRTRIAGAPRLAGPREERPKP
ncbi:hypothetical protein SAMN05444336_10282 [Albimonas donghaensis]|uniref:Uncharacterized protein n=1 Tax=Albimonas donghaensis TaxID=356660 RepID=A0A1H2VII8_9RHOB|nr:hypothetical protein SAMN05444336_10282 [Albimonas donghaensis]